MESLNLAMDMKYVAISEPQAQTQFEYHLRENFIQ